jgi:hypothetical protein
MERNNVAVVVKDLVKRFGSIKAVDGISYSIIHIGVLELRKTLERLRFPFKIVVFTTRD